jgi:hypothetical protein
MTTTRLRRKYALTKGRGAGDWLLFGNDDKTLWRLSYEDSTTGEGWCLWRWHRKVGERVDLDTLKDWSQWDLEEQCHPTRKSAIQAALKLELPKPKPRRTHDPRPVGQILVDAFAAGAVSG